MNVYDFDGTIYRGDSTVDFYLYALKRKPALLAYLPKQFLGFVLYGLKRIDKTQLKETFYCFLSGIDAREMLEDFWNHSQDKIYPWYLQQRRGDDIVISASPEFLLRPICSRLGIERLIASRVDARSGRYTGANCRGQEKVVRLQDEYGVRRIDSFYSDSQSDLPLARIAEKAFLIKKGNIIPWKVHC